MDLNYDRDPMFRFDRATMHLLMLSVGKGDDDQYASTLGIYKSRRELEHLLLTAVAQLIVERQAKYGEGWWQASELEIVSSQVDANVELAVAEEQFRQEYGDGDPETESPEDVPE